MISDLQAPTIFNSPTSWLDLRNIFLMIFLKVYNMNSVLCIAFTKIKLTQCKYEYWHICFIVAQKSRACGMDQLLQWSHYSHPLEQTSLDDSLLTGRATSNITFVLQKS